ncbi:MAG TPA: RHS repeat-associated core domain-containing protein [Candidatus Sulfotelmatobacter sp.]|nr:RHS repeat-associated core domain-containing protein [Candidatus Sulfotelmatobacter sp.]
MKIGNLIGIAMAICLITATYSTQAQTTNLANQILQMHSFREGLVWIGDKEPSESEDKELLEILNHLQEASWTAGVEQFCKDHPASPWAASLHYDYASFCRRTGRTTKALEQFEAAWAAAKNDASPQGQRLGGSILANWTDLLSSLGRLEKLKELVAIGDQWHFVTAHDRDKFQGAKHSYDLMQLHPEIAYRCGTFALKAIGGMIQPGNTMLESLVQVPSPTNGFSMAGLVDLAKQYGLNLVAVRRTAGQDLIVPSVVHWRQNHYAAILEKEDDSYLVSDPTFGNQKWLPAEVINEEASGEFLIPAELETNGWAQLARNDATMIHGMGLPNNINDGKDKGPDCDCTGMPVAWVSEPYVNVWMADEPISYHTSSGQPITFRMSYKQRDSRPSPDDYLVSNAGWNNSWASYVKLESETACYSYGGCMPSLSSSYATVYLPNGGEVDFNPGQSFDSETRLTLLQQNPELPLENGKDYGNNGLRLVHPDGSQDIYGLSIGIIDVYGDDPEAECLLTRHIDVNGDTTWFQYDAVNLSAYVLTFVIDPDGHTNTLAYTSNNYLSAVTNAYGQSAHFKYDGSGNLTNIVDAQGLSSSISYDTNGYPTALNTLYGTTTFSIFANSTVASTNDGEGNFGGDDLIDRAVQVTDPIGATSLYMFRYDCSSASPVDMSPTYSSSNVPTNTPLGTLDTGSGSSTNTLAGVCYRNSFYWGPRQFAALSTTNMNSFVANDYLRGRMRHWLEDTNQLYLTSYVSVEQDPSPDGSTPGLQTFYDYQGKQSGYNFCAGTYALPSVVAWRLPNGETHFEYKRFDSYGNVTNDITTYTQPNGSFGTRTNQFIYANNTYTAVIGTWNGSSIINTASSSFTVPNLLSRMIGADGNTVWANGGFDTVTWTNFFNASTQTNCTTLTSSRLFPDYMTNGLGQVTTTTYSSGGNPVAIYDLWPGTATETNYYFGTYIGTTFPGFSKVTSITSIAGLTTTNIYNATGFLARTIDLQIGRTNSFGYTTDGLIGTLTNELGLNVALSWDNLLRLTSVQYPDGTYTSNRYDRLDLGGERDRMGNWTSYVHDGARHLIVITNANNAETFYSWCGCGALTEIVDALTNVTYLNYDLQGKLTNTVFPDSSTLNYTYDLAARPTALSDGMGRFLNAAYNNQSLITTVSNVNGTLQLANYDILDRPSSLTDANGITITNTFDVLNRILTRTWPDGIGEGYGYTAQGMVSYTNRDQRVTLYGRNAAGWLMAVTNANGEADQVTRDPAGDMLTLLDGLNHQTQWQLNQYGWVTNKIDALGRNAFQYTYNPNGWLTNRWTPEKGNTAFVLDGVGNVTRVIYPQLTISNAYNALNELTNMVDATGAHNFTWTPAHQLQSESDAWTTVSNAYSQGLRTNLTIVQSGTNWTQSYAYDTGGRLTNTVSMAGGFIYQYQSTLLNTPSSILLPNGSYITNTFDSLAKLKSTALANHWGHVLDGCTYAVDPLSLRTNITRNLGLTTNFVNIGYDKINQLTSWTATETNGTPRYNEQFGWSYDAADNVSSRTNNLLVQNYTVDSANEMTNITRTGTFTLAGATPAPASSLLVNGQAAQLYGDLSFARTNLTLQDGSNTFSSVGVNVYSVRATNLYTVNWPLNPKPAYDNNGNLTNDGVRSFGYDAENEMTNMMLAGAWRTDFIYDGMHRRRIERDYSWSGSSWVKTNETRFVYDGNLVVQERDTNNNVLVTYTHGLDLSSSMSGAGGVGGLLARSDANGSVFYHADGNGNVTALIDGYENIVGRYEYDPFGKLTGMWGKLAAANTYRFSSMSANDRAGTVAYTYRTYLPTLQRWAQNDPMQERGGLNLYQFVRNSPVGLTDVYGLDLNVSLDPPTLFPGSGANCQKLRQWQKNIQNRIDKEEAKEKKCPAQLNWLYSLMFNAEIQLERNGCNNGGDDGGGGGPSPEPTPPLIPFVRIPTLPPTPELVPAGWNNNLNAPPTTSTPPDGGPDFMPAWFPAAALGAPVVLQTGINYGPVILDALGQTLLEGGAALAF